MSAWLTTELARLKTLFIDGTSAVAVFSVVMTYVVTRALMKTLGALVLAGIAVWGVSNISWFQSKVQTETGSGAPTGAPIGPPVVVRSPSGHVVIVLPVPRPAS